MVGRVQSTVHLFFRANLFLYSCNSSPLSNTKKSGIWRKVFGHMHVFNRDQTHSPLKLDDRGHGLRRPDSASPFLTTTGNERWLKPPLILATSDD